MSNVEARYYSINGPPAEDCGDGWNWRDDSSCVQVGPLRVQFVAPGRVLVLDSGPLIVDAGVSDVINERFQSDVSLRPVDPPNFIQVVPKHGIHVANKRIDESGRRVFPLPWELTMPSEPRSAFFVVENEAQVVIGAELLELLVCTEPTLQFTALNWTG